MANQQFSARAQVNLELMSSEEEFVDWPKVGTQGSKVWARSEPSPRFSDQRLEGARCVTESVHNTITVQRVSDQLLKCRVPELASLHITRCCGTSYPPDQMAGHGKAKCAEARGNLHQAV